MKLQSINPFTEEVVQEFNATDPRECDEAILRAGNAFLDWRARSIDERCQYIKRAAGVLRENKLRYAQIITEEMGKPIGQSLGEVEKCAWLCDFYADATEGLLTDEVVPTEAASSYVTFEPLGVILGIMPWNFPFWQVFRFAIPAMAAGNVVLLKHASNVPRAAMEIAKLLGESGFPPYVFQTLLIDSATAMKLIENDAVAGVSLTGSVGAGGIVGGTAGLHIKKLVLELGGSDPFIILDDADIEKAAQMAIQSRFINSGQSCIAAKRMIVASGISKEFLDRFIAGFQALRVGDPMVEGNYIGPMAKKESVKALERQLADARDKGGDIILGQEPPAGKGFFFQPAVVMNVAPDMRVLSEEVFGPIAPIIAAADEREIVQIANTTAFGLGASIWSRDIDRAVRLSKQITAGFVAINDMVKSDPRLPFGGVKKSGIGRELSHYGLKEFANIKTIIIQK